MKTLKYFVPIFIPFLIMVIVNEYARPGLPGYHNTKYDAYGMNPNTPKENTCTWTGFFNTKYCKDHHVKYLNNYYEIIDPIYFGMIKLLHRTGNYAAGNIIFMVILWPAIMYFLLIRIIMLRKQLKNG